MTTMETTELSEKDKNLFDRFKEFMGMVQQPEPQSVDVNINVKQDAVEAVSQVEVPETTPEPENTLETAPEPVPEPSKSSQETIVPPATATPGDGDPIKALMRQPKGERDVKELRRLINENHGVSSR